MNPLRFSSRFGFVLQLRWEHTICKAYSGGSRDNDPDPPSQAVVKRIAVVGPGRVEASDRKVVDVMVG